MSCCLPVLVVEDSFLVAASLEDALIESGHSVTVASSVAEAKSALAQGDFAAALLDYMLADGDSLALARQLHAAGCKVAIVSGVDRGVVPADSAIAARFAKPMDESELIKWVQVVTRESPASQTDAATN